MTTNSNTHPAEKPEKVSVAVVTNILIAAVIVGIAFWFSGTQEPRTTAVIGAWAVALGGTFQLVYRKNGRWIWPQNVGAVATAVGGVLVAVSVVQTT